MMQQNENQLINRILEGDVPGYAVLVDRHKDMAYTIAFRILGKREDSEEVVQDAFVKAFQNLSSFRQDAKFSTWLYRIVYNTAISRKRIKSPEFRSIEDTPYADKGIEPDEDSEKEQGRILEQALKKLPEEERTILTLFYLEESSVEEIHTITGLSKANIKIKLFRSRKKLQEIVKRSAVILYG
jgi:RNA polymerase sigma factor (sigma-70 family)